MERTLMFCAIILMACIVLSRLTHKLGLPSLLLFILLGMIFGSDGAFKIEFSDYYLTEQLCTIALIFIIFYGGFGINWKTAKPVMKPSLLLSTLGVLLTAGITGLFCCFFLHLNRIESFLIGAVISSTDAAAVFSILRSKKLNLKDGTASILELESGSNDPMAYMLTIILINLMNQTASLSDLPLLLIKQLGFGAFFGVLIGFLAVYILRHINFMMDGLETLFVLAIAIFAYTVPTLMGGNGYLATYLTGIIIGNGAIPDKVILVNFFDGITGLAQILIFFLLGLLSFPSQIPSILIPALLIFLWLTFIARPLTTFILMKPFKSSLEQKILLSWSGLRGASSIVFAILVVLTGSDTTYDIFHISFCICLISVLLQGTLLPVVAKKLNMIDDKESVLKTFSDYQETENLPLLQISIAKNHGWANRAISDLNIVDTLILMIRRDEQTIIPNGDTVILPGDQLVVSGTSFQEQTDLSLTEIPIDKNHSWLNKTVKELELPKNSLIILIKHKDGTSITPKGDTTILEGDIVILTYQDFNEYTVSCIKE